MTRFSSGLSTGWMFLVALAATIPTTGAHAGEPVKEGRLPVKAVRAFEDVIFDRPIVVTHAGDGTNRIFVAEQEGIVKVMPNDPAVEEADVFLDIDKRCRYRSNQNEEGLLGLAFHPDFRNNGQLFVYYTTASEDHTSVISRFTSKDRQTADPDSEEVIMKIPQPFWNHNGGTIAFGPDGMLYVGLGDGGSGNDPNGNGQNLTTLLGSILRINVDKADGGRAYSIPADNPFIDHQVVMRRGRKVPARPEIYAYGLRNVWRMAFDRETGDFWVADVGQNLWEEINIVTKGGNYGWNRREARHWFRPDGNDEQSDDLIDPVWEYHHDIGKSITGGLVYRGKAVPQLTGKYVYGDYVSGLIWALEHDGSQTVANYSLTGPAGDTQPIMSFGEDEAGEIYFTTPFGQLWTFESE
ncbi:MAG: PQQ-dependent sugar dehydrogenase [Planctomycetaceae bacterium]|nr:PQQ-dependent sugar dehydrogenase [Planctomycetaceae bacterium]